MKKQIFSLIIGVLSFQQLFSQTSNIEREKWADKPAIHHLDNKYSKESAVVLYDNRRVEFIDEPKNEVAEYYTLHRIIHINDDRGIETFNKIYLGFSETSDVVDVKARTILPGGKIIELDKNNIKDLKEEDGGVYKIFALDGLEKGCEVEYLYTFKRSTSFFGREVVQERIPILQTTFSIIAPDRLRFEIKPYNFSLSPTDTVISGKRIAQCNIKETAGAEDEKYSFYGANLERIEFKLSFNDMIRKGERLFTWTELAKRIFAVYTYYSDKEYKKVTQMVADNGWDKLNGEVAKITAVENFVKKSYSYNEDLKSEEGNKLENVIQKKIAGTIGITRLYAAIFQSLDIKYQFVLTGNRSKYIIDRGFENWNNCDDPLFYFPVENKFIAPSRPDYRYPWIVPEWAGTNGLFCKTISVGSLTTAIAEVKPIVLEDYTQSYENIDSRLELNKNLDSLSIDSRESFGGYDAVSMRDAFNFANDEQKRTFIKELAKAVSSTDHIISSEVLNKEFEDANSNLPVVLHIKTKSDALIESAGDKLLVKIGLAIGPQVEMYQEKPRQAPVDIDFGHIEERKIDFIIPDGYTISNANDLKIDQTFKDNGELTMGFASGYEIKGNVLSVHIMEEYRKPFYPLAQFDQFRKIINASSDFNKVVLILVKKS
ncbi:uncharacterized protein DUF3857 [Mucilaginibacter frigoritolerans]|uniref:Uncharacterized protein DUF3857 n=1 Tax=Mucilaginibacter frigoritolerans TaxID=652788 RepID=A0A562U2G1_9SPHI|nr:DUF3857 domain-containing protein [Mucilaginibacter frigoritolerans]TWI99280.1 uncharacterized protein DUF3857 [Mucilaginibacter frigoritolerans]